VWKQLTDEFSPCLAFFFLSLPCFPLQLITNLSGNCISTFSNEDESIFAKKKVFDFFSQISGLDFNLNFTFSQQSLNLALMNPENFIKEKLEKSDSLVCMYQTGADRQTISRPGMPDLTLYNVPKREKHTPNGRKIYQMVIRFSK
jgi:hypothetical protein